MNWINLHTATLRSPEFIGSEPTARATWLCVLGYCCEQENRGRIKGAKLWKDRQWQQTCGVTAEEIADSNTLLTWDGDDLVVTFYPIAKELEIREKRNGGKVGGKLRASNAKDRQRSTASYTASSCPSISASTEGKGREGKDKKREGKNGAVAPVVFPPPLDSAEFAEAWGRYVIYRQKRRMRKLLPDSVDAKLAEMAGWGLAGALESIRQTIANGWTGLFAPKEKPQTIIPMTPGFVDSSDVEAFRKRMEAKANGR